MTIQNTTPINSYTAVASQTVFQYTFEIFDKADISVEQNLAVLTEGTHYTVSGVNAETGGNVTLVTGATTGDAIVLRRAMDLERLTDYQQNGDFLAGEVNNDIDRLWAAVQQSTVAVNALPLQTGNSGKFLTTNGASSFWANSAVGGKTTPTVNTMVNDIGLSVGDIVQTKEFSTGNGGGGAYSVVSTASVTVNGFNIVIGIADPTIAFVLIEFSSAALTTRMYGAVSGDITALMQQFALSTHKNKVISSGTYDIASTVKFLTGEESITFEGNPTFNANGTYTSAVIEIGNDALTLLNTTIAIMALGLSNLPLTGLLNGDIVTVWNPVDGSWNAARVDYRQGEFCRVAADSAAGVTEIVGGLIDTYPVGTQIFKLDNTGSVGKITGQVRFVSAVAATRLCLLITQNVDIDISGLQVTQLESTHSLFLKRCLGVRGIDVLARQTASSVGGTDYGLVIGNSQSIDIIGEFHAERHGCTLGGDSAVGAPINRFVNVSGVFTTSGRGNVAGANWHGNSEFCRFGGYMTGLDLAGHHNEIKDGSIIAPIPSPSALDFATVACSELKSMEHDLSNITIRGEGNPQLSSRGVFDCGGNSTTALNADTVLPGKLNLRNTKVIAPIATACVVIRNRGATINWDVDISGMVFDAPLAASGIYRGTLVSGTAQRRLFASDITDPNNNIVLVDTATKVKGMAESATHNATSLIGTNVTTNAVTFAKPFPKVPNITLGNPGGFTGAIMSFAAANSVTTTGFIINIMTADASNFTTTEQRDVGWRASLDE